RLAEAFGLPDGLDRARDVGRAPVEATRLGDRLQRDHAWRMPDGGPAARPSEHVNRLALADRDMHVAAPPEGALERRRKLGLEAARRLPACAEAPELRDVDPAAFVHHILRREVRAREDRCDGSACGITEAHAETFEKNDL